MAITDRADFRRLILQIERELLSQAHLRTLLTDAAATVAGHRRELRTIEARLKRTRAVNGMRARH
jgi:hypothetical protein